MEFSWKFKVNCSPVLNWREQISQVKQAKWYTNSPAFLTYQVEEVDELVVVDERESCDFLNDETNHKNDLPNLRRQSASDNEHIW